jgi:hypothetical protein
VRHRGEPGDFLNSYTGNWMRPDFFEQTMMLFREREQGIREYAFAVPDEAAIQALVKLSPLVEFGAGTGYWAALLTAHGADVVAYDSALGVNDYFAQPIGVWFPVHHADGVEAVAQHGDRTLLMVWPPMDDAPTRALTAYTGTRLAVVGEWEGCTATSEFFAALEAGWDEQECLTIPQWWGLHDYLWVFKRKEAGE